MNSTAALTKHATLFALHVTQKYSACSCSFSNCAISFNKSLKNKIILLEYFVTQYSNFVWKRDGTYQFYALFSLLYECDAVKCMEWDDDTLYMFVLFKCSNFNGKYLRMSLKWATPSLFHFNDDSIFAILQYMTQVLVLSIVKVFI